MITYEKLDRWKYRLATAYTFKANLPLKLRPSKKVGLGTSSQQDIVSYDPETDCVTVRAGYCWDGPSGPTIDDDRAMRPSLIHDAYYQLIRMGLLPEGARKHADEHYARELKYNGYPKWRYLLHYKVLQMFGADAAKVGTERPKILTAP